MSVNPTLSTDLTCLALLCYVGRFNVGFVRWVSFFQGSLNTGLISSLAVDTLCSGAEGQDLVFENRPFMVLQGVLPGLHLPFKEDIELLDIPCHSCHGRLCFSSMVPTHRPLNLALTVQHLELMKASNNFPLNSLKDFFVPYIMNYLLVTTFYSCICHLLWLVSLFHKLRALPNIGSYTPSGCVSLSDIFIHFLTSYRNTKGCRGFDTESSAWRDESGAYRSLSSSY